MVMKSFKNLICVFTLLVLLAESSSLFAQTVRQCRRNWVLTTLQDMNFGAFSADAGTATITMNSTGGLTTAGSVTLSTSVPVTTWTVNVDNTLGPVCATYGFTIQERRIPPQPLAGPGNDIPLGNIRVTIPAYGLADVNLPQVIAPNAGNTAPFTITVFGEIAVTNPQTAGEYSRNLQIQLVQNNRRNNGITRVRATAIVPLSIAESVAMDFGTIAGGSIAGTVVLSTGNGRTTTGDVQLLAAGPGTAATFQITGEPSESYSISFTDGILENAGGQNMSVTSFTDNSGGSIPGSGTESFQVGATLSVGSNQPAGTYSSLIGGGNPYTVTINYN
jgi:hypothetical protein